ncbi:response regulator [Leptospira kobayashii]|uniref:Response regulator n=1 Tax=Leptospira kobayashii TaxID=1917830 RepID=A0ABN6KHA4_9LEPT|nr:response regulator [Leptospira kobayashii]BDA79289.1 response regulator [Leptospira kobayashii]
MSLEVLVVDDDFVIIFHHKMMITKSGFHSEPASFANGKDALEFLMEEGSSEKTYLVLLDINMPVMNGWAFLEAAHQLPISKQILVVMVTSSIDARDKEKSSQYPEVIGFAEKPIDFAKLDEFRQYKELKPFFS